MLDDFKLDHDSGHTQLLALLKSYPCECQGEKIFDKLRRGRLILRYMFVAAERLGIGRW